MHSCTILLPSFGLQATHKSLYKYFAKEDYFGEANDQSIEIISGDDVRGKSSRCCTRIAFCAYGTLKISVMRSRERGKMLQSRRSSGLIAYGNR